MIALLVLAILVPMLIAAGFLLGRHAARRHMMNEELSPVSRQHIELFQGGQLNETLVEAAKTRLRELLERGELAAVEASLRPGMHYVVHVRALAEIGTDDAGRILERQLQRRLSEDQLEQSWYWIDLANGLRTLNREESLPYLLRCSEIASELPLGHIFAAETVCILGFSGYLRQADTALGRAALRVLHRALEGLRFGVQPAMIVESRLGEVIEGLWDHRPENVHPLVVRVASETLRLIRRNPQLGEMGNEHDDGPDHEALEWQMSRLAVLEPVLSDFVEEAPAYLRKALASARGQELRDTLLALNDLRAEAATEVLLLLEKAGNAHGELMAEVLTWSRDPRVGPWLRGWVHRRMSLSRRSQWRRQPLPPRRPSVPADLPYRALLRALRGHGSPETEDFLVLAAGDWDPTYRACALGSLGWWEPYHRPVTLACLQQARRDCSPEVRQCARAALARLGERAALQWFRTALTGEEPQHIFEAIQLAAAEGLTLLWPDLDRLTEADDPEVAHHAREALERLCEEMDYRRGQRDA
jgi:HEAT repeat protein